MIKQHYKLPYRMIVSEQLRYDAPGHASFDDTV